MQREQKKMSRESFFCFKFCDIFICSMFIFLRKKFCRNIRRFCILSIQVSVAGRRREIKMVFSKCLQFQCYRWHLCRKGFRIFSKSFGHLFEHFHSTHTNHINVLVLVVVVVVDVLLSLWMVKVAVVVDVLLSLSLLFFSWCLVKEVEAEDMWSVFLLL